jgi:hypothetical protein
MWRTEIYGATFNNSLMDDASDIPARRVVGGLVKIALIVFLSARLGTLQVSTVLESLG